ncbi:MAG: hypothetical protein JW702_09020 [Clostridiales bacterium]|nr:hypothetical protein [Clostridiales bacterium]
MKTHFNKRISYIRLDILEINLVSPFVEFYREHNKLPDSYDDFSGGLVDSTWNKIKHHVTKDYLSKKDTSFIYYPLYNRNHKKDAYIIVSAGIDGRINNDFNPDDTVYKDNFYKKYSFYNFTEDKLIQNRFDADTIYNKFHLINFLFGKKDYLIYYVDCEQSIYMHSRSIKEYLDSIK